MNPMPEIIPMLKQLRLSGILDSLETRNRQAIDEKLSYMDFLATIITDEIARRSQKRLATALRRANFRNQKTLEEFDFSFNPNLNRQLIMELASCRFIEERVCVLVVGPCGTGKSHIAQALGHCAIRAGHDVLFTTVSRMLGQLHAARATNGFDRSFAKLAAVDLLIIDDFGLKPLKGSQDEDFHDVIATSKTRHSIPSGYSSRICCITACRAATPWQSTRRLFLICLAPSEPGPVLASPAPVRSPHPSGAGGLHRCVPAFRL
jgi:DNA replication protein DnaC